MIVNAVVPAKGNSTRVKDKNLQKVGGKSMTFWACERCLKTPSITNTYLDTEDDRIVNDVSELIAKGLKIINRPVELASNKTSGNELIVFEQKNMVDCDVVLHTYATAPMLTSETMEMVLQKFKASPEHDSFFTAVHFQEFLWDNSGNPVNFPMGSLPNAVDLPEFWLETHGLYGIRTPALNKLKRRLGETVLPIEIPRAEALDINNESDLQLLRILWNRNG